MVGLKMKSEMFFGIIIQIVKRSLMLIILIGLVVLMLAILIILIVIHCQVEKVNWL